MTVKRLRVAARHRRTLVVMVKVPLAGRVKTRLARGIGAVCAAQIYRQTTHAVLARVISPREWHTVLAVAPDPQCKTRMFASHIDRIPQGQGDLGDRMQRVMDTLPPGPVLIIGSDIPGITCGHIRRGFQALGRCDAVFGPAPDGGYWMVGMRRCPRVVRAFDSVRWSSPHALADTRANLKGLRVALVDVLDDIDDADALAHLQGTCGRRVVRSRLWN